MMSPIELRRPLAPLDLGGVLAESFGVLRRSWLTLLAIFVLMLLVALPLVVALVALFALAGQGDSPAVAVLAGTAGVAAFIFLAFWAFVAVGAILAGMGGAYLGVTPGVRAAFRWGLRRVWALIGSSLLLVALFMALWLPATVVVGGLGYAVGSLQAAGASQDAAAAAAVLFVPMMCLLFPVIGVATLYVIARLGFAPYIAVLEEVGAVGSLRRSWAVTRRHVLRVIGYVLVLTLVAVVVSLGVQMLLLVMWAALPALTSSGLPAGPALTIDGWSVGLVLGLFYILLVTVATVVAAVIILLVRLFTQTALMVLYFDLRRRDEGFGAELPPAPAPAGPGGTPPAERLATEPGPGWA